MNPFALAGVLALLMAATGSSRHKPQAAIESGAVVAVLIWSILAPAWVIELGMLVRAIESGQLGEVVIAAGFWLATTIVLFPWPIARLWLIPRARPRLAWAITRLSFWAWRGDVRGGALIAASWALARRAQSGASDDPASLEWIERRMAAAPRGEVRWQLGGAGIIALGLLAEARHDRAAARRLMVSAGELAEPTWPRRAICLSWAWLCAEAMTRGAWREVEFLARTAPVQDRTIRFHGAVAARLTGIAPLPNDLLLRWLWFAAPRRLATRELLRRALAMPATPPAPRDDEPAPTSTPELPEDQSLLAALTLHAHLLARGRAGVGRLEVERLAAAWDQALADPQLERLVQERGAALGASGMNDRATSLADAVREDLLALIRAAGLDLGQLGDSEILGLAARRLHGELLDGLEIAAAALESRVESRRELPALDEWQTFLGLREQYAEAVALGGLSMRRLAFSTVHGPVCSLAVWLWNDRRERAIGNAMFGWLLAEAVIVDDAEAMRLQQRNVDCGV